ncbi:MAG: AurF N-oxygenase family protein [Streptosporangiaceae bacterium]
MTATMDASTAVITCQDGNHTLALTDREIVAERLIRTSRKHSFNPDTDVDWDAPPEPGLYYGPPEAGSLYETPLWDGLTPDQRIELTKHEVASLASFGIWSELALMQILIQHAYRTRYDSSHFAYALTETADECRHSVMFGRMVKTFGLTTHRPGRFEYQAIKTIGAFHDPMLMFAATLVIEEFTDAMQRITFPDERVQPLVRQVSRIHVIEEARHIKYAREELKRQVARSSATRRKFTAARLAWFMSMVINRNLVHPSGYEAVGLDPKQAHEAAATSPHRLATKQWASRKSMAAFEEVGFLDGRARKIWQQAGFLAPA